MVLEKPEEVIQEHLANTSVTTHRTKARSPHKPRYIVESESMSINLDRYMDNMQFKLTDFGACESRPPESLSIA